MKTIDDTVQLDAREFGVLLRTGWRIGLLVARNVERGIGQGARQPRNAHYEVVKVSAQEFGRLAGTSAPRVLRHLDAWELAADAGHVPHATDLVPGQDVELDDLPDWDEFYGPILAQLATNRAAAKSGPGRGSGVPLSAEETSAAYELFEQGASEKEVAEALDISGSTAHGLRGRIQGLSDSTINGPSVACRIEPATELIQRIELDVKRLLSPMYSLGNRDRRKLRSVLETGLRELEP